LLLRRYQTGYMDGYYSLIAGHVEPHERVSEALVREAAEEAGIRLREDHLHFLHVMQRKGSDGRVYLDFYFAAEQWAGDVQNGEPSKCDDLRWVSPTGLPENTIPHVREVLVKYWAGTARFSEYGWDASRSNWGLVHGHERSCARQLGVASYDA
jgi:8-oxo-dGTP diphosphatase